MRLFRTKIWHWRDIWLLKWCCLLFGMIAGAYMRDIVLQYVWIIFAAAVILMIRPAMVYFKD